MIKKYFIFSITFLLGFSSCNKDRGKMPNPKPLDWSRGTPAVYVPISEPVIEKEKKREIDLTNEAFTLRNEKGENSETSFRGFSIPIGQELAKCNKEFLEENYQKFKTTQIKAKTDLIVIDPKNYLERIFPLCGIHDPLQIFDEKGNVVNELNYCYQMRGTARWEENNFMHYKILSETSDKYKIENCRGTQFFVTKAGLGTPIMLILEGVSYLTEFGPNVRGKIELLKKHEGFIRASWEWCETNEQFLFKGDLKPEEIKFEYNFIFKEDDCGVC